MIKIGIEINGPLRDTVGKFKQLYEKYLIDGNFNEFTGKIYKLDTSGNTEETLVEEFNYEILSEIDSLDMMKHFSFRNSEELFSFMFEEYTMELFGHAQSSEMNTFNVLNDLYVELRDKYDMSIISDEIGKSKPSSLFFLSKFGCLIEKVIFYNDFTKDSILNSFDILLTSKPDLLLKKDTNQVIVKYNTNYNKHISSKYEINSLSEFGDMIKKITEDV
jgi:hypothetical protein